MADYVTPVNQYLKSINTQPYERYLPNAYNDSLTMLEKINKVIYQMQESSLLTNEMVRKWNEFTVMVNEGGLIDKKISELLKDEELIQLIDRELMIDFKQTFNKKIDVITTDIHLDKYENLFIGDDVSNALLKAIEENNVGATIIFNPHKTYVLSKPIIISKPMTIDFNNAKVILSMDNKICFDLLFTGEGNTSFKNRIKLINYYFETGELIPLTIIRTNGAINTLLSGNMSMCTCIHSQIWNWKGYGTHITGEYRDNIAPRCIYLSNSSGDIHSFAFNIDVDITRQTGKGIEAEGGNGTIKGVIESCLGGYEFNGVHISTGINISVHFEYNKLFDLKIGNDTLFSDGSANQGLTNITNSYLARTIDKGIIYGSSQTINITNSFLTKEAEPISENTSQTAITFVGCWGAEISTQNALKIGYTSLKKRDSKIEKLTVKERLTVEKGEIASTDNIKLIPKNSANHVTITDLAIVPQQLTTDLGGEWNRFKNVYTRKINLLDENGVKYNLSINNSGQLVITEGV